MFKTLQGQRTKFKDQKNKRTKPQDQLATTAGPAESKSKSNQW